MRSYLRLGKAAELYINVIPKFKMTYIYFHGLVAYMNLLEEQIMTC